MNFVEAFSFAYASLNANKLRTGLTMLGMVIGTASIILVVTIGMTGRDYVLQQIEGIGSNLIYFYYEAVGSNQKTFSDDLTLEDLKATQELPVVSYAAGIVTTRDRVTFDGREREISVIGATDQYVNVRNLRFLSGRFWDASDEHSLSKPCLLTEEFAKKLFGSLDVSGETVKLFQVQFDVIGVFKEGVETFGQSEVQTYSALVPLSVLRRFTMSDKLDLIYVSARNSAVVPLATQLIRHLLEQRHRQGSAYRVENMTQIMNAADRVLTALTLVLFLIGTISLVISGIGIMNIMLVTVTERTSEIGIRMAVGARRREILYQFLTESILLATSGGVLGIFLGISGPVVARLSGLYVPIPWVSIVIAFTLSFVIGVTFGILPSNRAAKLSPIQALHYD